MPRPPKMVNKKSHPSTAKKAKIAGKKIAVGADASAGSQAGPLKPKLFNEKVTVAVPESAANLFAKIAATPAAKVAAMEDKSEGDSSSEELSAAASTVQTLKKPKTEPVVQLPIGSPVESSHSSSFSNIGPVEPITELLNRVENLENKIDDMARKQDTGLLLLAQAHAKIDLLTSASQCKQIPQETPLPQQVTLVPVKCLKDLEDYEERCKNDDFVTNVVRTMEQIHGKNRYKSNGATVCLQIIDRFADRRFLRKCSWTGISKTVDENNILVPKIAFGKYESFINLFYTVVRNADDEFTKSDCIKFLKQCLRNSKQRLEDAKMVRLPAARNRGTQIIEEVVISEQPAEEDISNMIIEETVSD